MMKAFCVLFLATCVVVGQAAPGVQRRQFQPSPICANGMAVQKFAMSAEYGNVLCHYLGPALFSVSSPLQSGADACPAQADWLTMDWCGAMSRQCYCCEEATTADQCLFCWNNCN